MVLEKIELRLLFFKNKYGTLIATFTAIILAFAWVVDRTYFMKKCDNKIVITSEPIEKAFPLFMNYDQYPNFGKAYILVTDEKSSSLGGLLFGPEYVWVGYESGKKQHKEFYYGFYARKLDGTVVLFIDVNGESSKRKLTLTAREIPKTISIRTCGYHFIVTVKSILEKNHETWLDILTFSEPGLYLPREKAGVPGKDDEAWIRAH